MEELTPETPDEVESVELIDEKKSLLPAWAKYVIAAVIVGLLCLYLALSGWGGYAYAFVKCGVKQPLIASTSQIGSVYYGADNRRYSAPGEGQFFKGYYCTEQEARAAGFLRAGP
jgi:hypothetical protein